MSEFPVRRVGQLLTVAAIGAVSGGAIMFVSPPQIDPNRLGLESFSIIINSILTLALVGLYYRMAQIQSKQATLAEIERTPLVEISGYEINDDELRVFISNYGNGTATQLELVTVCHFESDSDSLEPSSTPEPMKRATENPHRNYEQSIRPHDERVEFTVTPGLVVHKDQIRGGFAQSISMLQEAEINNAHFQLHVRYSTRTGKRYSIPLMRMPRSINVEENLRFSDAFTVEWGVTAGPRYLSDPDVSQPPYLGDDPGIPVRQSELGF